MNITTTHPEQTIGACLPIEPEWLRVPDSIRVSGIGRSTLYDRIKSGDIKSVCVRKRGCQRGIRLISADSLQAYIESFIPKGPPMSAAIAAHIRKQGRVEA